MQMFLKSLTCSSSHTKPSSVRGLAPLHPSEKTSGGGCVVDTTNSVTSFKKAHHVTGFTLVELLVSIAIIIIVTSMVLLRYDKFDSTILLKNAAYDVALTLREAQMRSVSAVRGGPLFEAKHPYGVTFTPGTTAGKEYVTFRYASSTDDPYYDVAEPDPDVASEVGRSTIDRSMYICAVCAVDSGGDECGINRLDVSFRRPEFRAFFHADGYGGAQSNINGGKIVVKSPKGSEEFVVNVVMKKLGSSSNFRRSFQPEY